MTEKVKLYTSLPPEVTRTIGGAEVGTSYLAECVRSWRRAGFDVVSLNGAREIEVVARQGYEAEYRQIARDRPSIGDLLAAVRASQAPVAGIINADVLFMADPGLLRIAGNDAVGMTLFERINIDPANLRPTGRSCSGFDAFIFATAPLSRIDQGEEFLFGHPWWDYWFPLAYVAAGGRLRTASAPVLFHLDHKQKWRQEHLIANGRKAISCLRRLNGNLPDDVLAEIRRFATPGNISESEVELFGSWCFAKLRTMAEPIEARRQTSGSDLLGEFVALLDDPQNRILVGALDSAEARVLAAAEVSRAVDQMSPLVGHRPVRSNEDAVGVADRAARILGSRKATLSHFWTLNIRWFEKACRVQAVPFIALRNAMKAAAEALVAIARAVACMAAGLTPKLAASRRPPRSAAPSDKHELRDVGAPRRGSAD
jgi:hypothetical protein